VRKRSLFGAEYSRRICGFQPKSQKKLEKSLARIMSRNGVKGNGSVAVSGTFLRGAACREDCCGLRGIKTVLAFLKRK